MQDIEIRCSYCKRKHGEGVVLSLHFRCQRCKRLNAITETSIDNLHAAARLLMRIIRDAKSTS